ncbi:MAG TPA: 2-oxoglutarate dehydrogenase, E2 component, dihydrolipoamide succinyltransferase [Microlunatus sp.]|nr:2-oxoglutarate dehydrogenase, E2 component, dihydrolipoamide succinyltransferase [Microlunatus sp.]
MSTSVTLPALGESVTEGTVTRWLKQVGDTVAADEPLLEVSTDKVDTEIPSPAAGVLLEIKAAEDETVEVGAVLAVIGDADEQPSGDSGGDQQPAEQPAEAESAAPEAPQQPAEPQAEQTDTSAQQPQAEQAQQPQAEDDQPAQPTAGAQSGDQGTEVTLPALGESVTEGTVSRWLKQVGESVAADEPLLEVSTDKVDTEIPSPTAGTLLEIRVKEDETVEVGAVLGVIGSADAAPAESAPAAEPPAAQQPEQSETEQPAAEEPQAEQPAPEPEPEPEPEAAPAAQQAPAPQEAPATAAAPAPQQAPAPQAQQAPSAESGGPGYVTPLVRKLAAEHQVDLSTITGTGVGGRIRKQDVLAAAEAAKAQAAAPAEQPAAPAAEKAPAAAAVQPSSLRGTTEKMSRLRKIIAKRMVESLQTSAQLTTVVEVDLTVVSRLRAKVKDDFLAREGVKLSYLPFLIKAAVDALKVHPKLNATIDTEAETITYPASENISIAVDTDKGLVVPVIKNAGDLSIAGLAKKIADLAERTRNNKLSPDDIAGGTFTVTNTGSRGALIDTPIVNQPQVAILGTGALVKRPVVLTDKVLGETIAVRDMMYLSLSYDHRIVDGADAARFLGTLKERLEEGDFGAEFGL